MATNQPSVSNRGIGIDCGIIMATLILFAGFGVYVAVDTMLKTQGEPMRLLGDLTMAALALFALIVHEVNDRARLRASIRQYRGY